MSRPHVLIVGASIAGPTTAYWFAKAGFRVTVIERYPSLRTGGQSIDIRTCGVTVMRKMGDLETRVRACHTMEEGATFFRSDGSVVGTIQPTGNPEQQSLVSEFEIFRGELSRILYEMTKDMDGVEYIFGEQVASMQQSEKEDGPITVEFLNGRLPPATYDLVVACDGATSRTRAMGFGIAVRDHITPLDVWAAYFSIEKDLLHGSKKGQAFTGIGGRFVALGPDPAGPTRGCTMAIYPRNLKDATADFRKASKEGEGPLKEYVAQHFRGAGWRTEEILDAMMNSTDFYASEIIQVKLPRLYNGRFTVVGDAGYGPGFTGTGTSLALAGAYVLAGEVSKHRGDISAGLKAYEDRMKPIIHDLQKIPPGLPGILAPQSAWGIWLRNLVFSVGMSLSGYLSGVLGWLGQYFASAFGGDTYKLPEYERSA